MVRSLLQSGPGGPGPLEVGPQGWAAERSKPRELAAPEGGLGSAAGKAWSPVEGSGPVQPPVRLGCSRVVVAGGGRDLAWPAARVAAALLGATRGRPVHLLLHGDARGADQAIDRAARRLGWAVQVMPAEWERHGRAAGPIRNRQLLRRALLAAQVMGQPGLPASVLVVAFPGGRGTASLVDQALELDLEVVAIDANSPALSVSPSL